MSGLQRMREFAWLGPPVAFIASLEVVVHQLDWPLVVKFALVVGVPAASALLVPWAQLKWVFFSLPPLLMVSWLLAGGTAATADTSGGTRVGEMRLAVEVIKLGFQTAGFVTGIGLRVILRGVSPQGPAHGGQLASAA
jgi:hypothetical protein